MVRRAHNDGMLPPEWPSRLAEHGHDALRCAGPEYGTSLGEAPEVVGMEAVDILLRIDPIDDFIGVELRGEGALHQNPMHRRIGIEGIKLPENLRRGGVAVIAMKLGGNADGFTGPRLIADVDFRGGIVTHKNHCEPGTRQALGLAGCNGSCDLRFYRIRNGFAFKALAARGRCACCVQKFTPSASALALPCLGLCHGLGRSPSGLAGLPCVDAF